MRKISLETYFKKYIFTSKSRSKARAKSSANALSIVLYSSPSKHLIINLSPRTKNKLIDTHAYISLRGVYLVTDAYT
jgi:hypothetical protein